jgi:hypothetical protein
MNAKLFPGLMLFIFCLGLVLIFWISPTLLADYAADAPRASKPATGAVYGFNQHGTVVFLTFRQLVLAHGATVVGFVMLASTGLILKRRHLGRDS